MSFQPATPNEGIWNALLMILLLLEWQWLRFFLWNAFSFRNFAPPVYFVLLRRNIFLHVDRCSTLYSLGWKEAEDMAYTILSRTCFQIIGGSENDNEDWKGGHWNTRRQKLIFKGTGRSNDDRYSVLCKSAVSLKTISRRFERWATYTLHLGSQHELLPRWDKLDELMILVTLLNRMIIILPFGHTIRYKCTFYFNGHLVLLRKRQADPP
jgi:hypothetical protein